MPQLTGTKGGQMTAIGFTVYGIPAPQAGMRAVNTAKGPRAITTGGVNLRSWRNAVSEVAREHAPTTPLEGPLGLTIAFRFPMPKSRRKADRDRGWCWKTTTPDTDKLLRAIGDSLTAAGLCRDDALFVDTHISKVETTGWTGAQIWVEPIQVPA